MTLTRAGTLALEQLRLEQLSPEEKARLPWGGASPRTLTDAYNRFTLKAQADDVHGSSEVDDEIIDEQCRRHFNGS